MLHSMFGLLGCMDATTTPPHPSTIHMIQLVSRSAWAQPPKKQKVGIRDSRSPVLGKQDSHKGLWDKQEKNLFSNGVVGSRSPVSGKIRPFS